MRYSDKPFFFFIGLMLFSGVMLLTVLLKKATVNRRANEIVATYAKEKAKSLDTKYTVTHCGEQVTSDGTLRRMYDITFTLGETIVVWRACVTVEHKEGNGTHTQLSSWPAEGGPIEVHEIDSDLRAKL